MKWGNYKMASLVVVVLLLGVLPCVTGGAGKTKSDPLEEDVAGLKRYYKFEKWASKTKMKGRRVEKLLMDKTFFNILGKETRISSKKSKRDKNLNLTVRDLATNLDVSIDIGVLESAVVAHERMIRAMAFVTAPLPVYKRADPNDPNDPLNIGDVCFGPTKPWIPKEGGKPVLRQLMFSRNNVLVCLRNSLPDKAEAYPDLRRMALIMDEKLKALSKEQKQEGG